MKLRVWKFVRRQFARVVKGVDLRSTARTCAWVRTPQLTKLMYFDAAKMLNLWPSLRLLARRAVEKMENLGIDPSASRMLSERSTI